MTPSRKLALLAAIKALQTSAAHLESAVRDLRACGQESAADDMEQALAGIREEASNMVFLAGRC